jgi:DNA-binding FadR family transcriptional regulator
LIESEATRQAALRATADEVAEIKMLLTRLQDLLSDDSRYNYEDYLAADIAFHTAILKACHNELLSQIGSTMRTVVHKARESDIADIAAQKASLPFHVAIVDGISHQDPDAAYKASQEMFENVWQQIIPS